MLFYGLLPLTLNNLCYRMFMYFVLPLFGQAPGVIEDTSTFIVVDLFSVLIVLLFVRWLRYDFVKLRTDNLAFEDQRVLYLANWTMVIYYLSM